MSEGFFPKVSIIIPVYNGANYMREAIDSALAQTYNNIEVIVVNDGSNDDGATREIALSYGNRIKYFEKENGGVSSALNMGIREMTGEYFSWLSHDDFYLPNKIYNSVEYLSHFKNKDNLVVICGASHVNEKSEIIRSLPIRFSDNKIYYGVDVIRDILTNGMLNCCCMLIPKTAFEICALFNEDLRYNQDSLILYQIFGGGYNLVACQNNLDVMYRLHSMQTSNTRRDLLIRDSYELSKIIAPIFAAQDSKRYGLLWLLAKKNALHACKGAVKECLRIGRSYGNISWWECICIYFWRCVGFFRNFLKHVYRYILLR